MDRLMEMLSIDQVSTLVAGLIRFLVILVVAYVISTVVGRLILGSRQKILDAMRCGAGGTDAELDKRATTLVGIVRRVAIVGLWIIALVMALKELGFDIAPILAGAGVVGLAVGFGAQNLVRDVITGLFMLVENQIRIGDVAEINGTGGLVEEVNLRTTVLRSLDGTVHVFPNGIITNLSNKTRGFSFYVFELGVAYKEDTDRVVEVIREVGNRMREEERFAAVMIEPVDVLGVDQFADSAVVIKGRLKTQPSQQWMVGREFNRRIKKRFDELGIEIPFPHMSVYFGEASAPFALSLNATDRDTVKSLLRDVLRESRPETEGGTPTADATPPRS
jgi:small conductance mechanosensitive channel